MVFYCFVWYLFISLFLLYLSVLLFHDAKIYRYISGPGMIVCVTSTLVFDLFRCHSYFDRKMLDLLNLYVKCKCRDSFLGNLI